MKVTRIDTAVLRVPTAKPVALELPEHRLVVAPLHTDAGLTDTRFEFRELCERRVTGVFFAPGRIVVYRGRVTIRHPPLDRKEHGMRKVLPLAVALVLLAAGSGSAAGPELRTEDQKTLYAIGLAFSNGVAPFALTEAELEIVKAGLTDGVLNRERKVDLQTYGPKIQELQKTRAAAVAAVEKKAGQAYLVKAAAEKGATKTASGLVITTLKAGTGPTPKATDTVKVNYQGALTDGTVFDSSAQRGQPVTFPLNQVIRCWGEGVQLMKVGGKSRLVCPAELAYGDRGAPPKIKPGATLVFEVELIEIVK